MNDNSEERDAGLPPVGTPEELEEALKWLEDLTARQGKPADLANPVPAASIDSPFRGLIEGDDGDLPDWLREVPTPIATEGLEDTEPESRLDWLAKMAQRESIEELPTLEWRRLAEPLQSAILADQNIELPTGADLEGTDLNAETVSTEPSSEEELESPATEDIFIDPLSTALPTEEPAAEMAQEALQPEENPAVADEPAVTFDTGDPDATEKSDGIYADTPVPVDDLDAAMAWIEEFAASQDAPIEEVPSVADRALASKLMMEAGLPPAVSPLDELGSDSSLVEGMTPTHPFIEEEDFADTVVLVETLAAEQEINLDFNDEPSGDVDALTTSPESIAEEGPAIDVDTYTEDSQFSSPDELSFEEAMALLDKMAAEQALEEEESVTPLEQPSPDAQEYIEYASSVADTQPDAYHEPGEEQAPDLEPTADEQIPSLAGPHTSPGTIDEVDTAVIYETAGFPLAASNGIGFGDLESTLLNLDSLALPPGKTLGEIDAKLRAARITAWRDIPSALDWLESSLAGESILPSVPLVMEDDAELIARMPEDPDEVLAWLEGMAAQEENRSSAQTALSAEPSDVLPSALQPEPLVEHLVEADLLNMPDDPDEAMVWLENLAREGRPPAEQVHQAEIELIDSEGIEEAVLIVHDESPDYTATDIPEDAVGEQILEDVVLFTTESAEQIIDDEIDMPPAVDIPEVIITQVETESLEPAHTYMEEIVSESTANVEAVAELVPVPAEPVLELPEADDVVTEPQPKPAGRRSRAKAAKPADIGPSAEPPTPDVETENLADEQPQVADAPTVEKPAEEKPRVASWVDLLKPLD